MIELKSFDLKVQGSEVAGYTVEAVGPAGERVESPFDKELVAGLAADLQAIQEDRGDRAMLERVGTALFQALFPVPVMMVYVRVGAQLGEGQGLRLRLHLSPELARLPWELLYCPYPPHYLSLDPRSPVVRFLDLPDTPQPLKTRPPLRLLHLVASPKDAPELNTRREATQLQSALAGLVEEGKVEIVPGQPGTQAMLRDGVRHGCHALHFSGHGGFDAGEGYLLFEADDGRGQPVSGDTLALLLRGTSVRLAVLNACESGLAAAGDAFSSVAAALVRAGLPAVIAHQDVMPDDSAATFAAEFYRALADNYPVDSAVSEGRKAIFSADRADWATPVLFLRAPDGCILTFEGTEAGTPAQQAAIVVQQQVSAAGHAATIGTISGGTVSIDFGSLPAPLQTPAPVADPLPDLLAEFRQVVRDQAPETKRVQAMDKVAALERAATEKHPDLDVIESVLRWFETELPQLVGAAFNVLGGLEQRIEGAEEDLLPEFRRRFGQFL